MDSIKNNPLLKIQQCGQSIWMDNLNRSAIESGELEELIKTRGLREITSLGKPAIFFAPLRNSGAIYRRSGSPITTGRLLGSSPRGRSYL